MEQIRQDRIEAVKATRRATCKLTGGHKPSSLAFGVFYCNICQDWYHVTNVTGEMEFQWQPNQRPLSDREYQDELHRAYRNHLVSR